MRRRFILVCCVLLTMLALFICAVFLFVFNVTPVAAPPPPHLDVPTTAGPVRGQLAYTHFQNRPYYAFRGIPYAQPPVGPLRFRPPQPLAAGTWTHTRDSFSHGADCLQESGDLIVGSEDCLTLNVYTPSPLNATGAPLAVLVYIFGGAFYRRSANSTMLGPDILIEQQLVVVTLNYRLGVLGYLAIDDDAFTGNWGLKDQQLALRWVQSNIAAFGGDRRRVTLAGQSSGSLSAQLHQLAAGSRGLFHRTIQMSTAFDGRATFRRRRSVVPDLHRLLSDAGYPPVQAENITALIDALQRIDASLLLRRFPFVQFRTPIMPTVESPQAQAAFIAGDPARFALEAPFEMRMDVLTGCTSNEAISQSAAQQFERFRREPRVDIPSIYFEVGEYEDERYLWAEERIFERYFPRGVQNATLAQYVRLLSDVHQEYPSDRKVRQLAAHNGGRTFQYVFDADTVLNYAKRWTALAAGGGGQLVGAAHSDDVCYVFYCGGEFDRMYENVTAGTLEFGLIERMAGVYGRFVRGEEMEWEAVRPGGETVYLRMGAEGFEQRRNALDVETRRFWDGIVREFGYEKVLGERVEGRRR